MPGPGTPGRCPAARCSVDPLELIREGKVKRYFRARRKLNAPGLVCHITQRGAGREPLFVEKEDYLGMIWILKEVSGEYGLRVHAFCLMPNHVHLLLRVGEGSLYDAMKELFGRYAMRFNRKYERKGHLFGGPYRQSVCFDPSYLIAASLYIHLNPVKAGLCQDPFKYRWSSCGLYSRTRKGGAFVDPTLVLALLGEDSAESRQRYRSLLEKGVEIKLVPTGEQRKAVESFLAELGRKLPVLWSWLSHGAARHVAGGILLSESKSWEEGIDKLDARGLLRKRESTEALKFAVEQLAARGFTREEIAQRLGVSRKTLYNKLRQ